jgi:hypothetical protein
MTSSTSALRILPSSAADNAVRIITSGASDALESL